MAPDFARLVSYPSLSDAQVKKVKDNQFVPLCYFLPLDSSVGMPPPDISNTGTSNNPLLQQLISEAAENDPTYALAQKQKEYRNAPHFYRWDQVITAFVGGLMPMMCAGRPDRLNDYAAFILSVIAEHSRGENEWPIFLRYIERIRRLALLEGGSTEEFKSRRAAHSLMATANANGRLLNSELFHSIRLDWASPKRTLFSQDFVDMSILYSAPRTGIPHSFPLASAPTPGGPTVKKELKGNTPPSGLSDSEWSRIRAVPSSSNAFCRNHLFGKCTTTASGDCPRKLPHLSVDDVKRKFL
jgi:hypothetical protein